MGWRLRVQCEWAGQLGGAGWGRAGGQEVGQAGVLGGEGWGGEGWSGTRCMGWGVAVGVRAGWGRVARGKK